MPEAVQRVAMVRTNKKHNNTSVYICDPGPQNQSKGKFLRVKFLAMLITNQKLSFDIFMVGHLQMIFMEHDLYLMP